MFCAHTKPMSPTGGSVLRPLGLFSLLSLPWSSARVLVHESACGPFKRTPGCPAALQPTWVEPLTFTATCCGASSPRPCRASSPRWCRLGSPGWGRGRSAAEGSLPIVTHASCPSPCGCPRLQEFHLAQLQGISTGRGSVIPIHLDVVLGGGGRSVWPRRHPDPESALTTILNLYRSDAESARQPYSAFAGLYLGT